MVILVFLVDTSASMNQKTCLGTTYLDLAKGAVESFLKIRARDINASRGDRYMLVTFDEHNKSVKVGWRENLAQFLKELKNLEAYGLTDLGGALKQAFDLLNMTRLQSGIDNYGLGRNPYYLEPALVMLFSDGCDLINVNGITGEIIVPSNNQLPGAELTKEIYRWDQRLFALNLKIPGFAASVNEKLSTLQAEDMALSNLCEDTGGKLYSIGSYKTLLQSLESIAQKIAVPGVIINFEKHGPDPEPILKDVLSPSMAWTKQRRMIFVRTNIKGTVGHWPIPESYWPDSSMIALPPRDSHPVIKFQCKPCEAMIIDNLPFDKYELEPSPLTQYILERKQPNIAWQVFVSGSSCDSEIGYPFGYLKAATNLLCVNLFVLPYNYPVVMPLIDELIKVHKCKPSPKWQQSFEQYLRKMPSYYIVSLQNAFKRMGVTNNLIPDHFDGSLNYNILSYMKRIKHLGKNEAERLINIHSQQSTADPIKITLPYAPQLTDGKQKDFKAFLLKENVAINRIKPEPIDDKTKMTTEEAQVFMSRNLPALVERFQVQSYKNPFDIHRGDIIDHVNRMRANFFQMPNILSSRMHDEELKHCISISMMGNYKEPELQQVKPLREVDSSQIRLHTFGNPFKLKEQDQQFIVDEADESAFNQNPRKRFNEPLALKVKRKRNDSAPSRRPVGRPNTPPPKLISFSKLEPVKNIINQVIDQKCLKPEDTYVKNNSKDSKVVNKKDDKKLTSINTESTLVSSSTNVPIFSLEVPKESLISNDVNNLSNHSLKQARLELQKKYPVKIRLEVWKALRERKDFQFILNLLESLNVSTNAKFLFINELIDESNRFQLHSLVKKLETLLQNLVISEKS
uniref:Integrator complex subunit 6 n=1 Tax=Hydra vulgaris TaxID=6087 RepID=T2M317_HYDVU